MHLVHPQAASRRRLRGVFDAAAVIILPLAVVAASASSWTSQGPVILSAVGAAAVVPLFAAVSILRRRPRVVTSADRVTLGRVALTGVIAAVTVVVLAGDLPVRSWGVAALVALALALDAVDGWVARRTGTATEAGARLDMESDAALLLVLSLLAAQTVGWWVLAIGAMRYLFVAAAWIRPRLRGELAYSSFRRTVAAIQGVSLLIMLIPIVPAVVAGVAAAVALTLLVVSFGRDIIGLERT